MLFKKTRGKFHVQYTDVYKKIQKTVKSHCRDFTVMGETVEYYSCEYSYSHSEYWFAGVSKKMVSKNAPQKIVCSADYKSMLSDTESRTRKGVLITTIQYEVNENGLLSWEIERLLKAGFQREEHKGIYSFDKNYPCDESDPNFYALKKLFSTDYNSHLKKNP